jgi:hypothetical protein
MANSNQDISKVRGPMQTYAMESNTGDMGKLKLEVGEKD